VAHGGPCERAQRSYGKRYDERIHSARYAAQDQSRHSAGDSDWNLYRAGLYLRDHTPEQWRQWVYYYRDSTNATPIDNTPTAYGDDDGLLNTVITNVTPPAQVPFIMPEARSNPTFNLKVTVAEARLTNGSTPGSFVQIDNRGSSRPSEANIQPTALFGRFNQNILLAWPSNRVWNGTRWQDPGTTDSPWYLKHERAESGHRYAERLQHAVSSTGAMRT